jgi:hypothetical protein
LVRVEREDNAGRQRGYFFLFDCSRDAERRCSASNSRTVGLINLMSGWEIFDEKQVQKM